MKSLVALIILIVLLCVLAALVYWRVQSANEPLRFVERELGGARFKAPDWRESVCHDDPDSGRLILKHTRNDNRIVYIAWQPRRESTANSEVPVAVREQAALQLAVAKMTGSMVTSEPLRSRPVIDGEQAFQYSLTFENKRVGPGTMSTWKAPATDRRWYLIVVDDDTDEHDRIVREFVDSFKAGTAPSQRPASAVATLRFDAPPGWRVHDENSASIAYISPNDDALLELHHGTRTSHSSMTKEYAQSHARSMIEATGAAWQARSATMKRDARLGAPVAVIRGTARIADDERAYEIRLWIAPNTNRLYVVALSTFDESALDRYSTVFDRISIAE